MSKNRFALVLNQDDVFYAEPVFRFLSKHADDIQCIILVPSYQNIKSHRKYLRSVIQMISIRFMAKHYGTHFIRKVASLFSPKIRARSSTISAARSFDIPFYRETNVNSDLFLEHLKKHHINIVLSVCSQIYGKKMLNQPHLKIYNFHSGLLPRNQGRFPIFWALYNQDPILGMTCHEIAIKIDAGPILFQKTFTPHATKSQSKLNLIEFYTEQFQFKMPNYLSHAIQLLNDHQTEPMIQKDLTSFYGPIPTPEQITTHQSRFIRSKAII